MNVIKILLLIFSITLFAKEPELKYDDLTQSTHEIFGTVDIKYGQDTIEERSFAYQLLLGYTYLLDDDKFATIMIKPFFSYDETYGEFITLEKTIIQTYLGGGYKLYVHKKNFIYLLGGAKIHLEFQTKSFNQDNSSDDIDIEYKSSSTHLFDFAPYLGIGWKYILLKNKVLKDDFTKTKNPLFAIKTDLIYEYMLKLNEYNLKFMLSISYIF